VIKKLLILVAILLLLPPVSFNNYTFSRYDIVAYYIQRNEIYVAYLVNEELEEIILPLKKIKCPRDRIGHLIMKAVDGQVVDYIIKE